MLSCLRFARILAWLFACLLLLCFLIRCLLYFLLGFELGFWLGCLLAFRLFALRFAFCLLGFVCLLFVYFSLALF
jgi:hypothetical protein